MKKVNVFKKRSMLNIVSFLIVSVFMWSNCVYASGFPAGYKLAAPPQVAEVGGVIRHVRVPLDLLSQIKQRKIAGLAGLAQNEEPVKQNIIEAYRTELNEGRITEEEFNRIHLELDTSYMFISADPDAENPVPVTYVLNTNTGVVYRVVPADTVINDNFFTAYINNVEDKRGVALAVKGDVFEVYKIREGAKDGIARALSLLYGREIVFKTEKAEALSPKEEPEETGGNLEKGWVLANHIFMSVHAAMLFPIYIDKILGVLGIIVFVHLAPASFALEVISGIAFAALTFYLAVGIHERGHYIEAVKQITLNEKLLPEAQRKMKQNIIRRLLWNMNMLLRIPIGRFPGINKSGLNYSVDAPYNLAVTAAGPRASRNLAIFSLPFAVLSITAGFLTGNTALLYAGRLFLGLSVVGLLDFIFSDPGEYKKFKKSLGEKENIEEKRAEWLKRARKIKERMKESRLQELTLPDGRKIRAPWGFRNSAMGGAHTQKEYPESNISMQEGMFIPLSAKTYEDAQRMTVELQNKLKQIIERTEGCRVMGIGLEGGLATFIKKDPEDRVPEQKMWRLMKQAIEEAGYKPGRDVVLALDPAASELQNEYNKRRYGDSRKAKEDSWETGKYLFWRYRDSEVVMTSDEMLDIYGQAINEGIPIVSIEDGFSEDDFRGWQELMKRYGDWLFIIGDDLVTTNDEVIEKCIGMNTINTALIKANQIGTLSETVLAMLTALGYGMELVVSHRSKSPNDDMEAQIALAGEAVGLKAGGGANTERLVKYGAIIKLMKDIIRKNIAEDTRRSPDKVAESEIAGVMDKLVITGITAYEEATNAGIPTVGVKITAGIEGSEKFGEILTFTGSTPLGTSAGSLEAIHLVDSIIEASPLTSRYHDLFSLQPDGTYKFAKGIGKGDITAKDNSELEDLWDRAHRYAGKGVLNAVGYAEDVLAKLFVGKKVSELGGIESIDRILMQKELDTAVARGKISADASPEEKIHIMQRKGNLGMNAVLSLSLALARMAGAVEGKQLWEVIRDEMNQTIAKAIAQQPNAMDIISNNLSYDKINEIEAAMEDKSDTRRLDEILMDKLTYNELVSLLQALTRKLQSEGRQLHDVLRRALPVYGEQNTGAEGINAPVSKIVRDTEQITVWEEEVKNGRVAGSDENAQKINSVMEILERRYKGPGIFMGIDAVRIINNLTEGAVEGKVPYSMVKKEGDRRILLLDEDALSSDNLLFLVLDHEFREGIMTLIPYESEAIRELTSNFLSVKTALDRGITTVGDVTNLDPDNRFLSVAGYIQEKGITEDRGIIALLIENMRTTPYYKNLFKGFSFASQWEARVEAAEDKFGAAINVFNEIADATDRVAEKVTSTVQKSEMRTEQFNKMIKKLKMVVSQLPVEEMGLAEHLLTDGKYIRLDIDELGRNPVLLDWIKGLTEGRDKSPFIFYSAGKRDVEGFLSSEGLKQGEMEGEVSNTDIVTLIDPEKVTSSMPQDTLYLPLPYAKSTVYLAFEVVKANGDLDSVDNLAKNTIRSLYEALLGDEVTDSQLEELFRKPWKILPEITSITGALNAVRTALIDIETAA